MRTARAKILNGESSWSVQRRDRRPGWPQRNELGTALCDTSERKSGALSCRALWAMVRDLGKMSGLFFKCNEKLVDACKQENA